MKKRKLIIFGLLLFICSVPLAAIPEYGASAFIACASTGLCILAIISAIKTKNEKLYFFIPVWVFCITLSIVFLPESIIKSKAENLICFGFTTQSELPVYTPQPEDNEIVYVTVGGKAYHMEGCRILKGDVTAETKSEAEGEGRKPCKICHTN